MEPVIPGTGHVPQQTIIFEHPLNERVRNFLRLELLFQQAGHFLEGESAWDSRHLIATLMELLDLFGRMDLKTEIIKELERNAASLGALAEKPGVDSSRLDAILERLNTLASRLHATSGQPGQELQEDPLLAAIRQRSSIPGGTCAFDVPRYHRWLHEPADTRFPTQQAWYATLDPVRESIELLLRLIRNSAEPSLEVAEGGALQRNLDPGTPFQMLRVILPGDSPYFAEVSGGRHRFTIRFLSPQETDRPAPAEEDVRFQLTCCAL